MLTWMLYGAYGRTGRLIVNEARRRGHRPILAGRDAAKRQTASHGNRNGAPAPRRKPMGAVEPRLSPPRERSRAGVSSSPSVCPARTFRSSSDDDEEASA